MSRELRGILAIFGSAIGYSHLPTLGKLALAEGVRVLPMVAWRFILASAVLWLFIGVTRRAAPPRDRWPALLALGALYGVNATAYLASLQWISASLASLVFFTYPAVVIVLAAVFLGEPLTRPRVTATLLAIAGCALIVGVEGQRGEPIGVLLILMSVVFVAVYILLGQAALRDLPAHGAAAVSLLATAALTTLVALLTGGLALGGGAHGAQLVALMALISTAIPVTLLLAGIRDLGPGQAAIYATVEPLLAVSIAALVLGERIAPLQYVGGGVLLSGILWLRLQRPRPPRRLLE